MPARLCDGGIWELVMLDLLLLFRFCFFYFILENL